MQVPLERRTARARTAGRAARAAWPRADRERHHQEHWTRRRWPVDFAENGSRRVTIADGFLDVPARPAKPRTQGLTHVMDKGLNL